MTVYVMPTGLNDRTRHQSYLTTYHVVSVFVYVHTVVMYVAILYIMIVDCKYVTRFAKKVLYTVSILLFTAI